MANITIITLDQAKHVTDLDNHAAYSMGDIDEIIRQIEEEERENGDLFIYHDGYLYEWNEIEEGL